MFCIKEAIIKMVQENEPSFAESSNFYGYCSSKSMPYCEYCYPLLKSNELNDKSILWSFVAKKDLFKKRLKISIKKIFFKFLDEDEAVAQKTLKHILIEQYLYLFLLNCLDPVDKDFEKLGKLYAFTNILESYYGIKIDFFNMSVVDTVCEKLNNRRIGELSFYELFIAIRIALINNEDITSFLVYTHLCRYDSKIGFSRVILKYLDVTYKRLGYSLEEGDCEYYAKDYGERYNLPKYPEDGTYFFERKIVEKLNDKFGKERYEQLFRQGNLIGLSQSFVNQLCLHYALLKETDEGNWKEAIKLIDNMEVQI